MSARNPFGWDLPPGCTLDDIDPDAEEQIEHEENKGDMKRELELREFAD